MKIVLFLLLSFNQISTQQIVEEFHKLQGETKELAFINKYKKSSDPTVKAYVLAMQFKQLEYMYNPIKQMSLFGEYKDQLQTLAKTHHTNVHVRYIRLLIQEETPAFLDYKGDIAADKAFLRKALTAKEDNDYLKKYIYKTTSL